MGFLDKSVETAVCSRSGYWPNYTTFPSQTKCKIFSQDVAAVPPLCMQEFRPGNGDYFTLMRVGDDFLKFSEVKYYFTIKQVL